MAIINTILPEQVSMVNNTPLRVTLASDQPTASVLLRKLRLRVNGSPAVGETLSFSHSDLSITLTVQVQSDDSGNTISTQGALSIVDYAQLLVDELNASYELFLNFRIVLNVQGSTYFIDIFPRGSLGPEFSFTNGLSNIVVDQIVGTNGEYQASPAAAVVTEIWDHAAQAYTQRSEHVLPVTTPGADLIFDLQSDFTLQHELPPVDSIVSAGPVVHPCTRNWTKYRLYYCERAGLPPTYTKLQGGSTEYYAFHGGRGFFQQDELFWGFWKQNGKWQTSQLSPKQITPSQPEWLYYLGRQSRTLRVRLILTRRDNTTETIDLENFAESIGQIYAFKTGFDQLGLSIDLANPIVKYAVVLVESGVTEVTERYQYRITLDGSPWDRFFLFGNSLGGFDTVRGTGRQTSAVEISSATARRIVTAADRAQFKGQYFEYDRQMRGRFRGSIGYKTLPRVLQLREMLLSESVYIVDQQGIRFVPIQIDAGSVNLFKDGDDLFGVDFSYQHAWEEQNIDIADYGEAIVTGEQPTPTIPTLPADPETIGG